MPANDTVADIVQPIFPPAWLNHAKGKKDVEPVLVNTLVEYETARSNGFGSNEHIEKHKQEIEDYKTSLKDRTLNSEIPIFNPGKRDSGLAEDIVSCLTDTEAVLNELRRQLAVVNQNNEDLQAHIALLEGKVNLLTREDDGEMPPKKGKK